MESPIGGHFVKPKCSGFEDATVFTAFATYERDTRWSGIGRHHLDDEGCLRAN